MKEIVVVAEDKVGLLADISYLLAKSKINIDSISVDVLGKSGIIHLTVKDEARVKEILENNGYKVITSDRIVVKIKDAPGEVAKISKMLADNKVSIENFYMITRSGDFALFSLKADKIKKATTLLKEYIYHE